MKIFSDKKIGWTLSMVHPFKSSFINTNYKVMENSNKLSIDDLKKMKAIDVAEDERVKARFISIYQNLHKSGDGESFYEKERFHFARVIHANKDLKECTAFSVYGVFLDLAAMGLTVDQSSQPLVYVLFYNQNVGTQQNPQWEKRAVLEISPYGELALRIQSGQIQYADRPIVVYEGDLFKPMVNERGHKVVRYECSVPRKSNHIIGSFIGLTRPDMSRDFYWMLPEDIERLSKYSAKKNKTNGANSLYSSDNGQIDSGFLEAKTIKHAFKTFPKIKLGQFSQLQKSEEEIQPMDYGLDAPVNTPQVPELEPFEASIVSKVPEEKLVAVEDDIF